MFLHITSSLLIGVRDDAISLISSHFHEVAIGLTFSFDDDDDDACPLIPLLK